MILFINLQLIWFFIHIRNFASLLSIEIIEEITVSRTTPMAYFSPKKELFSRRAHHNYFAKSDQFEASQIIQIKVSSVTHSKKHSL